MVRRNWLIGAALAAVFIAVVGANPARAVVYPKNLLVNGGFEYIDPEGLSGGDPNETGLPAGIAVPEGWVLWSYASYSVPDYYYPQSMTDQSTGIGPSGTRDHILAFDSITEKGPFSQLQKMVQNWSDWIASGATTIQYERHQTGIMGGSFNYQSNEHAPLFNLGYQGGLPYPSVRVSYPELMAEDKIDLPDYSGLGAAHSGSLGWIMGSMPAIYIAGDPCGAWVQELEAIYTASFGSRHGSYVGVSQFDWDLPWIPAGWKVRIGAYVKTVGFENQGFNMGIEWTRGAADSTKVLGSGKMQTWGVLHASPNEAQTINHDTWYEPGQVAEADLFYGWYANDVPASNDPWAYYAYPPANYDAPNSDWTFVSGIVQAPNKTHTQVVNGVPHTFTTATGVHGGIVGFDMVSLGLAMILERTTEGNNARLDGDANGYGMIFIDDIRVELVYDEWTSADFDQDGDVDFFDVQQFVIAFESGGDYPYPDPNDTSGRHGHGPAPNYIYYPYLMADRNANASVDFVDTLIFINQFNAQAGPLSVPEPTAMLLLAAGAVGIRQGRVSRRRGR